VVILENKLKVLQVIGSLNIGGAENIAMNFARFLDKDQFQVDFLVFGDVKGAYENEAIQLGCKVIHIDPPSSSYFNYMRNIKRVLMEGEYDVVHTHTLLNNGLTLKAAFDLKIKKRISHSHSTNSGRKESILYKIYSFSMKKLIKKYATDYIACGDDAGEFLYGRELFKKKGKVLKNGIDVSKYAYNSKTRGEVRRSLGIDKELLVGHVGRLTAVKNHDFLIEVFREIQKNNENTKLLIVGDGELRKSLEKKINQLGLTDNVIFTGIRTDIHDLLQAIDVIVFPSLFEGFPVSMVEAQAAGVPCIVSNKVTSQIKVTNLISFMSLEESAKVWAQESLKRAINERTDRSAQMKEKGFDVITTIKTLEKIYEK
jgi:glycosyltransferase involved in cell wall biosynthesis